ncbi:HEAT repeat domain-containing protein [Solibacillus daqui]|uniref:HEAT repeat domain-containing protein n=1 Tax=Solibacillus daqui TaxID=2912187 RepID=UPI002365921A|nr:HEAT repeat domain-containing protein [Solibacillus daqui]
MITSQILILSIVAIVVLLGIVAVLFFYLVFMKKREQRKEKKIKDYFEKHEIEWYNYLVNHTPLTKYPGHKTNKEAVDKLFVTYMLTVNNEDVRNHIATYAELNMKSYYLKQLQSKHLVRRINVLHRALLFNFSFVVPIIEKQLKAGTPESIEEYMLLLQIIAKNNPNLFLAHMYQPRFDFHEYEYNVLLAKIDPNYIRKFKDNFEELPIDLRLSLLTFFSFNSNFGESALQFYESLLSSIYTEIRIRALKDIASFGMITSLKPYRTFLKSEFWEERLMFAKILPFANDPQAYELLRILMTDSVWTVRRQAAVSLMSMKQGEQILQEIVDKKEDLFAAEMAQEVLKVG